VKLINFVPCSGATRRRMNVTSTIARPGAQSCGIVDVVLEHLFPEDASPAIAEATE
jgi:hypothetical protein